MVGSTSKVKGKGPSTPPRGAFLARGERPEPHRGKYAIFNSPANRNILSYLGIPYEECGDTIVFEGDPEKDLRRIADAIIALGYAPPFNPAYALSLAGSFFLNRVR